ncbi:M28 family metallopeptidase [Geodermatophilus pulveris]|uniref:M28 family metallopeptidase n=1 Tax=Geodermatophilus pulveris TaxID=1564159 RepID=UPI001C52DAE8|nr:M28 family metallopeptidase [Geodermatophilus pulveris]
MLSWGPDGALGEGGAQQASGELRLVTQVGSSFVDDHPDVPVVLDAGRYLVVDVAADLRDGFDRTCGYRVQPLPVDAAVVTPPAVPAARSAPLPWVSDLVQRVQPAALAADIRTLSALPTRHSTSPHLAEAVRWVRARLDALGYRSAVVPVPLPGGGGTVSVLAERDGTGPAPRRAVLATAHLDSVNTRGGPAAPAPGADDNASGSAGVLEIARVLRDHPATHDLRLILFGGEEQGLHGSTAYVDSLDAAERSRIAAVVNMDMIGCRNTAEPGVLLEGSAPARSLIDRLAEAAATYTGLTVRTSLHPFASDHVPFLEAGMPAVLTIEASDRANAAVHTATDTDDRIDVALATEILRMNVATIATELGNQGGPAMTASTELEDLGLLESSPAGPPLRQLSGRYVFNGGVPGRVGHEDDTEPVLTDLALDGESRQQLRRPRFTLHVDVDGTDPLGVVSGDVLVSAAAPWPAAHFIGRVTAETPGLHRHDLVVTDLVLPWGSLTVNRLEIGLLRHWPAAAPVAEVVFVAATGTRLGPYRARHVSRWFRDVEVEVDVEDGAVGAEPYDTHLHPDRPADLPRESLTLEGAFARAGIRITRSSGSNTIDTSSAGGNGRWNYQELHDAMASHWSAYANVPQWKMWVFHAELADSDTLGGVMFDGDINEPGGVDRQGTALFTRSPHFHTEAGAYPQANPPAAQAARRELFFDLVHETGHAFNLAHSFQKQAVLTEPGSGPWPAPSWMPLVDAPQSLSWMNYPDEASPGAGSNATWFYDRFRFRFDDGENLFLRHAPARFVQMGNEAWFHNHGRAGRGTLDTRLQLALRLPTGAVEYGESVFCELRLRNVADEPVLARTNLDPAEGTVELAVTGPSGERRPFLPFHRACARPRMEVLAPQESRYESVNLTMGQFGFPFKEPGRYRIEACWVNRDGSTAPAITTLSVRPPRSDRDRRAAERLFTAPVGRVLAIGGTRTIDEVNELLGEVAGDLGVQHPASLYLRTARTVPLAQPFKALTADSAEVRVLAPEPDVVERELAPVVEQFEAAADALGHIQYERVADVYSTCAVEVGKRADARSAQDDMLKLFQARRVVEPVIAKVEARLHELT